MRSYPRNQEERGSAELRDCSRWQLNALLCNTSDPLAGAVAFLRRFRAWDAFKEFWTAQMGHQVVSWHFDAEFGGLSLNLWVASYLQKDTFWGPLFRVEVSLLREEDLHEVHEWIVRFGEELTQHLLPNGGEDLIVELDRRLGEGIALRGVHEQLVKGVHHGDVWSSRLVSLAFRTPFPWVRKEIVHSRARLLGVWRLLVPCKTL